MSNYSIDGLVRECRNPKLIALSGRNYEENTLYAIEVCKILSEESDERVLYFSLKSEKEELKKDFGLLPFEIEDTAGLEVSKLVEKVRSANETETIGLVVVDYLPLLSSQCIRKTRQEEIENMVCILKGLAEEGIPILMLVPLSKYVPMDYSILQEFNQYGCIKAIIDVIAYVDSQEKEQPIKILKNEDSYIHYGNLTFDRGRFEVPNDLVYRNKPSGGFWASHCKSENSWKKWCEDNNYHRHCDDRVSFYFRLSPEANILSIETFEDCKKLPRRRTGYEFMRTEPLQIEAINYKRCMENGIDAIEYKYDVAKKSKDFAVINEFMKEWDCDSILILNPDIIVLDDVV